MFIHPFPCLPAWHRASHELMLFVLVPGLLHQTISLSLSLSTIEAIDGLLDELVYKMCSRCMKLSLNNLIYISVVNAIDPITLQYYQLKYAISHLHEHPS